ncbi:MAG: hypothetical protein A2Y73_04900 [Chloroflexi bacterium RBG_13_56_8]|nr:MAG: hypothetical protein A2Y73_04900 [Chloroflexi bacterium RBG_13_56_8]
MVNLPSKHRSPWKKAINSFLGVLVIFGALYSGYLFFSTVRALVARTSLPFVESVARASTERGRSSQQELPDIEHKKERVNILLLGIDRRENDSGPWRTDTMILASIDPSTNSAALLSIPRDLWVTIPGFGENRINAAHYLGDKHGYPGGGVALAKKTVWYALGVPVHYYVRIDFTGFERLIDTIGGVTIDVEKPIHDETYPDNNYGTMVVDIPAGIQHMDGKTALQYARSRHGTGDYDRMARQQAVILAARDKVLSLDIPLSQIPDMIDLAGSSVQTDLNIEELIALMEIGKRVDRSGIRFAAIDDSMTVTVRTPESWLVEVADWEKVRMLVDELFPTPASSTVPTPSLIKAQLDSEAGRIEVQNGTLMAGLAESMTNDLRELGFNVVRYDNADRFDYAQTVLIDYGNKQYSLEALATHLQVRPENIHHAWDTPSDVDILVILGRENAQ